MITRKNITAINEALTGIFKRTAAYTNKKFEGTGIIFSYKFLIAFSLENEEGIRTDNKLVLYFDESNSNKHRHISMEAMTFFRDKVRENIPSRLNISPEISLSVFLIGSKVPSNNDHLFDILCNCDSIIIPTSSGHGLNIVDDNRETNPLYEVAEFSRYNYVWAWRTEFGPNNCDTPEDDCTIVEYVSRVLEYI